MSIVFEDNFREAQQLINSLTVEGLQMVALFVVGEAKRRCPVDTGYLRGSIGYSILRFNNRFVLRIYTNVEYAIFVHEGTRRMQARRFIRDAIEQKQDRIARIVNEALKRGL